MGMTVPSPATATVLAFLFFIAPVVFGAFVWAGYLTKKLLFEKDGHVRRRAHARSGAHQDETWVPVGLRDIREHLEYRARNSTPVQYAWSGFPRHDVPQAWLADVHERCN